jgi:hypothetical protein
VKEYKNNDKMSIDIYEKRGFIINSPLKGGKPKKEYTRAKRGAPSGLSKSSRARLRARLVDYSFPDDWFCFGLTLTIPGYVITPTETRRLFQLLITKTHRLD